MKFPHTSQDKTIHTKRKEDWGNWRKWAKHYNRIYTFMAVPCSRHSWIFVLCESGQCCGQCCQCVWGTCYLHLQCQSSHFEHSLILLTLTVKTDGSTYLQNSSNTIHFHMQQRLKRKISIKGIWTGFEGVDYIQQAQVRPVVGSCEHSNKFITK